jgi:uncharacterized protein YoxC
MDINRIIVIVCAVVALCGVGFGVYYQAKATRLQSAFDTAGGELQQQLGDVTAELERTRAALDRAEQSVGELEDVDKRRVAGIRRIFGILDETGKSVSGIASGEQRARIAFEAIARITDELEAEFGGSAEQR